MRLDPSFAAPLATDILIRATCLLLAAGLVSLAVRRRSPAHSTSIWAFAFLGLCVIPVLSVMGGSRLSLKWLPAVSAEQPASAPQVALEVPATWTTPQTEDPARSNLSPAAGPVSADTLELPANVQTSDAIDPLMIVAAIWTVGALWVLARLAVGTLRLKQLARADTRPFSRPEFLRSGEDSPGSRSLRALSALRISKTDVPPSAITWGALRPTIVLPSQASRWTPQELEAVLLHELAHVRRKDSAKQLIAELACALYWFHPLVWLGARAMRMDAELAADEDALRSGMAPSDYASALLQIARGTAGHTAPFQGAGVSAMTHPRIDQRLNSILTPSHSKRGLTRLQGLCALLLMGCAVTALTAITLAPQGMDPEITEAMKRSKQLGTATLIYAADYNDVLPYVQSTASVVPVLSPYVRTTDAFLSPTNGARFLYNVNVGGVRFDDIASPAETPLWVERLSGGQMRVVTFVDSHVELVGPDRKGQIEKALRWTFKRRSGSRPLPKGHLINDRTLASTRIRSLVANSAPIANSPFEVPAAVAMGTAKATDAPFGSTTARAPGSQSVPARADAFHGAGVASAPNRAIGSSTGAPTANTQGGARNPMAGTTAPASAGQPARNATSGVFAGGMAPPPSTTTLPGSSASSPFGLAAKADSVKTTAGSPAGGVALEAPVKTSSGLQAGAATTATTPVQDVIAGQATTPASAPRAVGGIATAPAAPEVAVAPRAGVSTAVGGQATAPAAPEVAVAPRAGVATSVVDRVKAPTMYRWDGKGFVPVYGAARSSIRTPKPGLYRWDGRRYVPVTAQKTKKSAKPSSKVPAKH